jgi:hypothetical protein
MKSVSLELLDKSVDFLRGWLTVSASDDLLANQFLFDKPLGRFLPGRATDVEGLPVQKFRCSKVAVDIAGFDGSVSYNDGHTIQYDGPTQQQGRREESEGARQHQKVCPIEKKN